MTRVLGAVLILLHWASLAHAASCKSLDLQGRWRSQNSLQANQIIDITQFGCASANVSDPNLGVSYYVEFNRRQLTSVPTSVLNKIKAKNKYSHVNIFKAISYTASIATDVQGTFVKLEFIATLAISVGRRRLEVDVAADGIVTVKKKLEAMSDCTNGEIKRVLTLWIGHIHILKFRNVSPAEGRAIIAILLKKNNKGNLGDWSYSDTFLPVTD